MAGIAWLQYAASIFASSQDHLCPRSEPSPAVLLPLPLAETAWLVDSLKPFKFSKVATGLVLARHRAESHHAAYLEDLAYWIEDEDMPDFEEVV